MTPCCAACGSVQSFGSETVSLCTECAAVTVSGAAFSLPMIAAAFVGAAAAMVVARHLLRRVASVRPTLATA